MSTSIFAQRDLTWEFYNTNKKAWQDFGKAGSIQEKFLESKELPDPFYGTNEEKYDWIENQKWELKSKFYLSEEEFKAAKLELYFPNIDVYAEVFVNEKLVYSAGNFHHPHTVEIQSNVHCGYNDVKVIFTPPILYHKERFEKESFHYPAPNDPNKVKAAPLTRKPQYQFGWDWALRMNTMGFSKPVQIRVGKENAIENCSVSTKDYNDKYAVVTYHLSLKNKNAKFTLKSTNLGVIEQEDVFLKDGIFKIDVKINDPKMWWPIGFGGQHLYHDTLKLYNEKKELIDEKIVQFGIRKAELVQLKDKWGTSYEIHVNGIPIFCKGADYIPQSVFPAAVKDADIVNMIDQMVASNFNMVRVWGGGYYPDEIFFNTCDEKGIMVWEDLMFACAMYPGDKEFLASVETELNYQMPRISAHPSVVLINGNNEVDVAWKNWGFQSQYKLNEADQKVILKAYDDLFKDLAVKVINKWTNTNYIHTSPLSNWGNDDFYNHGSQHYWGVWHGKDPMSDFAKKIGRFNAEYGFQSFPEFSTMNQFSVKSDWSLQSKVMKHHQKSYVGNGMIEKHADLLFGKTKDFEQFVYYSQLTQAYAVSSAVAGHRLDAPRCMGTLYWQLNDCWPAPTWSSIDYYGNWKALQYAVRDDYRTTAVLKKTSEKGEVSLFVKSDELANQLLKVKVETFDLSGKSLEVQTNNIELKYQGNQEIWNQKTAKFAKDVLVKVTVNDGYARDFLVSSKKAFNTKPVWLTLENVDLKTKTAEVKVVVKSFVADFWLYSMQTGVKFDRNFVNLLPGTHTFKIHFESTPKLEDFSYKFR